MSLPSKCLAYVLHYNAKTKLQIYLKVTSGDVETSYISYSNTYVENISLSLS